MFSLHLFNSETDYANYVNSAYTEPWVSTTYVGGATSSITVTYNLKELAEPLTFEIVSGGTLYWQVNDNKQISTGKTIEFKKNQEGWTSVTASIGENLSGTTITEVSPGDIIKFRGINASYYGAYGTYSHFNTDATFYVYGNIMSLIDYRTFRTNKVLTATETFYGMFENTDIKLHPTKKFLLPATTLANQCYQQMFYNCSLLEDMSNLSLPATVLKNNCYSRMFAECVKLKNPPELPATTLAQGCYSSMFANCTSLTKAPELPATTLAENCYGANYPYHSDNGMFYNCTSLTTAPELPATTLAVRCYYNMFRYCTTINHIKCLATDITASECLTNWVYRVQTTGTFVKNSSMTSWPTGTSGIPIGWTVQDA